VQAAQAGLLRDRQQCEKSQGVRGTESPESFPHQTETETTTDGKSEFALSANRRFTLNQYKTLTDGARAEKGQIEPNV
jgi:hypothetical protein